MRSHTAKIIASSKRPQAERAAENAMLNVMGCVVTRRAIRTRFNKTDFFGADVIGIRQDGSKVFCQATCGGVEAVRQRRRKLEAIPWHRSDTVCILQLVERQAVVNARSKQWHFRVHEYDLESRAWSVRPDAIEIERGWFKAFRGRDGQGEDGLGLAGRGQVGHGRANRSKRERSTLLPSELFE